MWLLSGSTEKQGATVTDTPGYHTEHATSSDNRPRPSVSDSPAHSTANT